MGPILARISTARAWGVSGFVAEMVDIVLLVMAMKGSSGTQNVNGG
jgi:hypothetical protein